MLRNRRPLGLALVALVTGGAAPIFLFLTASTMVMLKRPKNTVEQMLAMHTAASRYLGMVLLRALLTFAGVWGSSLGRLPWLAHRLLAGVVAGLAGAVGLDTVRLWGYRRGYTPGNLPRQYGRMLAGPYAGPAEVLAGGYAYHALHGVSIGLVYALVGGPVRRTWGLVWGLVVFVVMILSPPTLMTGSGPFLRTKRPGPALVALAAHLVRGTLIGGITERIGQAGGQGQPRGLLQLLGDG